MTMGTAHLDLHLTVSWGTPGTGVVIQVKLHLKLPHPAWVRWMIAGMIIQLLIQLLIDWTCTRTLQQLETLSAPMRGQIGFAVHMPEHTV